MKWLFFDLGSTLIDEGECERARIHETVQNSPVTAGEFEYMMRLFATQNRAGYACACEHFGLSRVKWRSDLERLYPGVKELLRGLAAKHPLGVIANQNAGAEERLRAFGILDCFKVIAVSADLGCSKPDPRIFTTALARAGCAAGDAAMIGDRLDNDILPAQLLGMRTAWVRRGFGALGDASLLPHAPDCVADSIAAVRYDILTE